VALDEEDCIAVSNKGGLTNAFNLILNGLSARPSGMCTRCGFSPNGKQ